jgi:predicted ATP-grasp superfamily ATP-dependent carboligase
VEIKEIPALRSPIMLIAFSGWNDAGEAATGAITHLLSTYSHRVIAEVDSEDFYDFQVNRPHVFLDASQSRSISWPGTLVYGVFTPEFERDLIIVKGVEPSMRWKSFARDLLDLGDDLEVSMLLSLGALLADAPHTRPISIMGSAPRKDIAERYGFSVSNYQGPTGILGAIQDGAVKRGVDSISLWASIPHYASASPSPKASLALINAVEDLLEVSIPQGDLPEDARAWELGVDELAQEDSEVGEYVKALEQSQDAAELPEASGEAIAKEFERYLRRRGSE